jgi:hypothetical protein
MGFNPVISKSLGELKKGKERNFLKSRPGWEMLPRGQEVPGTFGLTSNEWGFRINSLKFQAAKQMTLTTARKTYTA